MNREAHERPSGMYEGSVIMSGIGKDRILESINIVTTKFESGDNLFEISQDYDLENVSVKVVRTIIN
jgi:UDP-N-acetylglucosamine 2-epimerase (non-hydrolysing)